MRAILDTLERHAKDVKRAYHRGTPGVTYDDMRAAVVRLLEMRAMYERSTGKTSRPITAAAIARTLRNL